MLLIADHIFILMQSVKELTPLEYYDTSFKPVHSDCNIFIKQPNVTVLFLINHFLKKAEGKILSIADTCFIVVWYGLYVVRISIYGARAMYYYRYIF